VESYNILIVLALGMVAFGLYTLVRAWRVSRTAERAWYSIESQRMKKVSLNWGLQAVVLFIAGASLLIWIALDLEKMALIEPTLTPTLTVRPSPTLTSPLPIIKATVTTTPTALATTEPSSGLAVQTLVPVPTLVLGSQAVITNTSEGLWMRDAPFGNGLTLLPEGTVVFVQGGLVEVDGLLWQKVSDADDRVGWVAADYLIYR
jgi:hypothetical protein